LSSSLSIVDFVKSNIAFGGCMFPGGSPVCSVVGHWDADHIPATGIHIIAPLNPPHRMEEYISNIPYTRIPPNKTEFVVSKDGVAMAVNPLGDRKMKELGIDGRIHSSSPSKGTIPIRIFTKSKKSVEAIIYIDDFDADDGERIKKLIDANRAILGETLKGCALPVYKGTKSHKSREPTDLVELSRELVEYAAKQLDFVIVLAHPEIPPWVYALKAKHSNIVIFERGIPTIQELKNLRVEEH